MKRFRVAVSDDAEADLEAIRRYIASEASPAQAERFCDVLLARCERLESFLGRGARRDDLGAGVRTLVHKRSATVVYRVGEEVVEVVGFFYRGKDVPTALRDRL